MNIKPKYDAWQDPDWEQEKNIPQFESNYLHPQRSMQHKVRIFYEELRNLSIDINNSNSGINADSDKFANFEFENLDIDNSPNENNAANFEQLFSTGGFRESASKNLFILDGNTTFGIPKLNENGQQEYDRPQLLTRNEGGKTEQTVGWMSRAKSDKQGYFEQPVRIVYEFFNEQSVARWLIRSHKNESPSDFSVCVYNANQEIIYKKVVKDNKDSDFALDINRGLCKIIELRITRWHSTSGYTDTNAKILYFYHNAIFPEGATDYYSNDLLQNFAVNEFVASGIGKANYGVQSNTGTFTLVNIDRYFNILKFAEYIKSGLKVQYFVKAEELWSDENVDSKLHGKQRQMLVGNSENTTELVKYEEQPDPDKDWVLLATHYIRDIEFDEVRHIVKFKTQDRLIDFVNHKYSGLRNLIQDPNAIPMANLASVGSKEIFNDLMAKAKLSTVDSILQDNGITIDELKIDNAKIYNATDSAKQAMVAWVERGYLEEKTIWAALQNACDLDLLHIYIDRDDVLVIDKIDQF